MDVFDAIKNRHSYRGPFKEQPIPRADLDRILDAAAAAPSGCNKEFTRLVMVDDPAVRADIAALFDMPAVKTAPALLVVVGDPTPAYGAVSFELADTAACVMNAWLAATALGYAGVWLDGQLRGGLDVKIQSILGIPPPLTARVLIPLGVPADAIKPPPKKPVGERAFYNRFGAGA